MYISSQGSCLCGAVHFSVNGNFDHFFLCHCRYCQKDTGSAHAANLFSNNAELIWHSGEDLITGFQLKGTHHQRSFCKTCGSALPSLHKNSQTVIPAGCLDKKLNIESGTHIFMASQASWEKHLPSWPKLNKLPK